MNATWPGLPCPPPGMLQAWPLWVSGGATLLPASLTPEWKGHGWLAVARSQERASSGAASISKLLCFSRPVRCPSAVGRTCRPPEPSFLSTLSVFPSISPSPSVSLSLSVALASSWREAGTGHSSEGCGNEQSSSALVMSRRENSSRELMRPPRTKEATTSRGQRGGAQRSRPRRTARPQ